MTPIINPMWFYWIGVVDGLRSFFNEGILIVATFLFFAALGYGWYLSEQYYPEDDEFKNGILKLRKYVFRGSITVFIFLIIGLFVPSQTTLIQMMTASYATSDNIKAVTEAIQETADSIIDKLNEK